LFPKEKELKDTHPELPKKSSVERPSDIQQLKGEPYYVGNISRDNAINKLKGSSQYTYLVRYGKDVGTHIYTISVVKQNNTIGHYPICYIKPRDIVVGVGYGYYIKGNMQVGFHTRIEDLIEYYKSKYIDDNTMLNEYLNEKTSTSPLLPSEDTPSKDTPIKVQPPEQLYVNKVNYKIGEEKDGVDHYVEMKVKDFTIYDEKLEGGQTTFIISYTNDQSQFYLHDISPVNGQLYVGKSIDDLIDYYTKNSFYYTLVIENDNDPKLLGNEQQEEEEEEVLSL